MKVTLNVLEKRSADEKRRWPSYMFGGRMRTSTLVLIVAFLAVWWVYTPIVRKSRLMAVRRPPRWCRRASCLTPTTPGCRVAECSSHRPPSRSRRPRPAQSRRPRPPLCRRPQPRPPRRRSCCRRRLSAAAALLPAEHEPDDTTVAATAAGARSGAHFAAIRQLTSPASEIHRYTGVP